MVNVRKAIDVNSGGTATLLERIIAERDRIKRLVVASSMVVYGEGSYECAEHGLVAPGLRPTAQLRERRWEPLCPDCGRELQPVPVLENRPLRPASVYGISKRDTEELALVLGEAYGFEATALRYLNVYGPRQALGNPYTGVAAIFSARLLAGKRPMVFEDGAQIRDLVHISDIVAATRAAMDAPAAPGRAFNVATGARVRIGELAGSLAALIAPELEPEVTGEFRAGDLRHCYASTEAAPRGARLRGCGSRSSRGCPSSPSGSPHRRSPSAAMRRSPTFALAGWSADVRRVGAAGVRGSARWEQ